MKYSLYNFKNRTVKSKKYVGKTYHVFDLKIRRYKSIHYNYLPNLLGT